MPASDHHSASDGPTSGETETGRLAGRCALVTGGGSGIGRATALRFAEEGARVAICGRRGDRLADTRRLAAEVGRELEPMELDVTDAEAVDRALPAVVERLGGLDTLVNNAGVGGPNACSTDGQDRWREILAANLDGVFYVTRAALAHIPDGGRILNVSSVLGKFGVPGYTAYCTSKHGIIGFTRALALELAPRRITVNAVCPGWVETDMARAGMGHLGQELGISYEQARENALQQVPLQRILEPAEIAALLAWLASEEASGMTGQAVNYSGGSAVW